MQWVLAMEICLKASKIDSWPFLGALPPLNKNKGGSRCRRHGARSPRRGSIRRAEGSDRGTTLVPAGDVCARRRRRQVGAPYFLPLLGFPPPEALKAFLKVKNARALQFLEALWILACGYIRGGKGT